TIVKRTVIRIGPGCRRTGFRTSETSGDVRSEECFGRQKRTSYAHIEFFGSCDAGLVKHQAREIAARPRKARDETSPDWVGNAHKHNRDRARLALQRAPISSRDRADRCGPE